MVYLRERPVCARELKSISVDGNGVDEYVHGTHLGARGLGDEIADLADDRGRDCAEIDAFVDHDVQVDGYGIIGAERDLDTLAHCLLAQQMDQPVRHGSHGHALDAKAVGRSKARDVGIDSAVDRDLAGVCIHTDHQDSSFWDIQFILTDLPGKYK